MSLMAFNPLPWFMTPDGFDPGAAPPLSVRLAAIKAAGFDAVHAEVPAGITVETYRTLLADHGLSPAPGYHQASFASVDQALLETSRRIAAEHAGLGLDRIFLAEQFGTATARLERPALGVGADPARLRAIVEGIGAVAEVMAAEGVLPCLHQHVGTYVETRDEVEAVLAGVPDTVLRLGPDTGHLAWAEIDPAEFIARHAGRVGAVHVKDIRRAVAAEGGTYRALGARHLWTEPGRGDIDFEAVFAALGPFDGWFVVEVDVADQPTVEDSARVSADWLRPRLVARS